MGTILEKQMKGLSKWKPGEGYIEGIEFGYIRDVRMSLLHVGIPEGLKINLNEKAEITIEDLIELRKTTNSEVYIIGSIVLVGDE